jgi:hypothetical protein
MTTPWTPQDAVRAIEAGNNGYADIGPDPALAAAVDSAGYVVVRTRGVAGLPTYYGYTLAGYEARQRSKQGRYRSPVESCRLSSDEDAWAYAIEGAILARQDADCFN